jgi:hypothetical protein
MRSCGATGRKTSVTLGSFGRRSGGIDTEMGREERDVNTEFIAMADALETARRRLKIRIGLSRLGPLIDPYRPPLAFALLTAALGKFVAFDLERPVFRSRH